MHITSIISRIVGKLQAILHANQRIEQLEALIRQYDVIALEYYENKVERVLGKLQTVGREELPPVRELLSKSRHAGITYRSSSLAKHQGAMQYMFPEGELNSFETCDAEDLDLLMIFDLSLRWGIKDLLAKSMFFHVAETKGIPLLIVGDGFLRSACTPKREEERAAFTISHSFTIDRRTAYYDATRISDLELMLNDTELVISDEQLERARRCIEEIRRCKITKYNEQPIYTPQIGRPGAPKVLVVDQSYADTSIVLGMADDSTFRDMLEKAIIENPEADIIVKTHPDALTGRTKKAGYYSKADEGERVYLVADPINPLSLIEWADKVYVCTSQFGFEAMFCGKEVHVFGMPFYAGWGATVDAQHLDRRSKKRSVEEIFYIVYILYSHYVDSVNKRPCEIERVIELLKGIRADYFQAHGMKLPEID